MQPSIYDLFFVDFFKMLYHEGIRQVYNGNSEFCQNI